MLTQVEQVWSPWRCRRRTLSYLRRGNVKAGQLDDVVDVCNMLGDPTRAGIIAILAKGPKSVGELCRELKMPQPTASHHLGLLRHTGLVLRKRQGKRMIYSLNKDRLKPVVEFLQGLK
jgi:ArsR family transcriptional regulator